MNLVNNTDITGLSRITAAAQKALDGATAPDTARLDDILARACPASGMPVPVGLDEAAALLRVEDPEHLALIHEAAGRVKEAVFGPRIVLFAPLYLSNYCSNDCLYCGFRSSNKSARRKALSADEAVAQARILSATGFKRLLVVAGEHPTRSGVDYLVKVAEAIYSQTDIRILHVNCAPLSVDEFKRLKAAGYGVYQCFQETYHPETYAVMHPSARKKDYAYRLGAMGRALEAGFGDVGIGALLGLYDYRFEALSTIAHSRHLEAGFGAAAHTVSVPRLRHAEGAALDSAPSPVDDTEFKKIVSVYRLALPYTGVVVSTREPAALRDEVITIGASQVSAGSSTEPGGYGAKERSATQFDVDDVRELSEMVGTIARQGLLPSLCTSCYRSGRQGEEYLDTTSSGGMRDLCTANALLSLKEYAIDSAAEEERPLLEDTVRRFADAVEGADGANLSARLKEVEAGKRDVRY